MDKDFELLCAHIQRVYGLRVEGELKRFTVSKVGRFRSVYLCSAVLKADNGPAHYRFRMHGYPETGLKIKAELETLTDLPVTFARCTDAPVKADRSDWTGCICDYWNHRDTAWDS